MRQLDFSKAIVLLSGGQDSTTSLFWAKERFGASNIHAISVNYGQKHYRELECAKKIAELAGVEHTIIPISFLQYFSRIFSGMSSLLDTTKNVSDSHNFDSSLPSSFVPGRNLVFLTAAGQFAYMSGVQNVVVGVCQTDYSGYPDCREEFISSMERTLRFGLDCVICIHAPVLNLSKKETVQMAMNLTGCLNALAYSHTCYNGQYPPCGVCPACVIRKKGFDEAEIDDPIFVRAKNEGLIS